MNHCSGGPATDQFGFHPGDGRSGREGQAPERIVARVAQQRLVPNRTRPLCPYPAMARYRGTGSIEDAASFSAMRP